MALYTPFSTTTAAALSRVQDNVPKGYVRYTSGSIRADKISALVGKFAARHAIHASPSQRHTRKKHGKANALLTVYCPSAKVDADMETGMDAETNQDDAAAVTALIPTTATARWLLLFTAGTLDSPETLHDVHHKPRLEWLGYELVRHTFRGKTSWTWRRTKAEMQALYKNIIAQCSRKRWEAVAAFLARAARQPGFHGVREQTWKLCQEAKRHGYGGELPTLFYMHKVKQGKAILAAP